MVLSRTWAKRATVNTDKTGYASPSGPRAQGTCQCACRMGRQDCSAFRPCAEPAQHLCGNLCHVPMGGCTPCLVGQSPQYGSQTYRSERMGGRPGPRSQHREQMTAPLLFVVGPKVATYRVQMRSPLLFEVGAEGGHIGSK